MILLIRWILINTFDALSNNLSHKLDVFIFCLKNIVIILVYVQV